jgi:GR25 family glycosyltransferase involved in LPS biosynthesis
MKSINQHFDNVYVLNLHKREDRKNIMKKRLAFCDIEHEFFDAVDGSVMNKVWEQFLKTNSFFTNSAYLATAISHLSIYRDALSKGHKKILILEDDERIHRNANQYFSNIVQQIPTDWNLLYLGFIPLTDDCSMWSYNVISEKFLSLNVFAAKNCWGLYSYAIDENLMKYMLDEYDKNFPMEIDRFFVTQVQKDPNWKCYGITPQIFAADDGYSDNSKRIENNMLTRSIDSRFASQTDYI